MALYSKGYGGYFKQGLASGISQEMQWGQQILDIIERKRLKDELKKEKDKILTQTNEVTKMIDTYGADNLYSDSEVLSLRTFVLSAAAEIQDRFMPIIENIDAGNTKQASEQIKQIDEYVNYLMGLDLTPGQVETSIENFKNGGFITSENALRYFEAKENIVKEQIKARELQPVRPTAERFTSVAELQEKYPGEAYEYDSRSGMYVLKYQKPEAPTALSAKDNWAINAYKEGKINFDELSKYMGTYIEPKKATTLEEKIETAKRYGASNEEIKGMLVGKTTEAITPEGEITAGQKRSWDMASSVIFGSSDWVTGISKPGIISQNISNKLNMGQPLTDDEKAEVRNNYNSIKGTLPEEIKSIIESQLQRYGIPLETSVITPEPTTTPEPEPKKWWEFWKKETKPELGPGEAEKDYSTMSEEELYNLAIAGDKKAYEEAKRRGFFK